MKKPAYGSRWTEYLTGLCNLFFLNLIYVLTILPIVTYGASRYALFTCVEKLRRGEELLVIRDYFQAFRAGWKVGTVLGAVEVVTVSLMLLDWLYYLRADGGMQKILLPPLILLTLLALAYRGTAYLLAVRLIWRTPGDLLRKVGLTLLGRPLLALGAALVQISGLVTVYFAPLKTVTYIGCFIFAASALVAAILLDQMIQKLTAGKQKQEEYLW